MMLQIAAYEQFYHGEKAVWLKCARYEAVVLPDYGANLIAFRDVANNYRFLHEPQEDEMEQFKQNPVIYGIPILYPPNRYEDGKFPWNGKEYVFPINEEKTGNHLHSYAHKIPWKVVDYGANADECFVKLALKVKEGNVIYRFLPFQFTLTLTYTLSKDGLFQRVTLRNDDQEPIPCTLAFHTAVNAPFAPNSSPSDYKVKLTAGKRWEMSERMLPTGKHQPLSEQEEQLINTGINPFWEALDNHYTAEPQNGRNRMELTDEREKVTLVYDVGTSFKQWMIWNNSAQPGFFCPEPQVNVVNAPNLLQKNSSLSAEEVSLYALEPGEIWEETSRLYCKEN